MRASASTDKAQEPQRSRSVGAHSSRTVRTTVPRACRYVFLAVRIFTFFILSKILDFPIFDFEKMKTSDSYDFWAFHGPLLATIVLVSKNCVDRSVSELWKFKQSKNFTAKHRDITCTRAMARARMGSISRESRVREGAVALFGREH